MYMSKLIQVNAAKQSRTLHLVLGLIVIGALSTAGATPLGFMSLGICDQTQPGVRVSATFIDFLPPQGPGNTGCILTGAFTNVTYTGGGPLVDSIEGVIKDLSLGPPATIVDFISGFVGNPNLHFDLLSLGPGPNNLVCAAVLDTNLAACSPAPGSPFKLSPTNTGTAVELSATLQARDTSGTNATWIGNFSTTFPGITPAQLVQGIGGATIPATGPAFCTGGVCTTTYSGTFNFSSAIPEPVSFVLIGCGLVGLAILRKRLA